MQTEIVVIWCVFSCLFWEFAHSLPPNDHKDPYLHGCAEKDRKRRGMIIYANADCDQPNYTAGLASCVTGTNGESVDTF